MSYKIEHSIFYVLDKVKSLHTKLQNLNLILKSVEVYEMVSGMPMHSWIQ